MKKVFILSLVSIALMGCSKTSNTLKILCPTGAPAVAFYNYAKDSNFETNSVPKNIVSEMNQNSTKDIIVIDTVSGLKAINNGAPFKIASTITFGNFYIASTGNDDKKEMDVGDTIVLFGEKSTPDLLFHYVFGNKFDETIEYVNAANDAASCLATGVNISTSNKVDYVLLAQPAIHAQLNNIHASTYGKSSVYLNMQEAYREKSNSHEIIQASVFVKNTVEDSKIKEFLNSLENDINKGIANPDLIKNGMDKIDTNESQILYGISATIARDVTIDDNKMGLGFVNAIDNKDNIDFFISLFGMEATNEEVYYK